MGIQVFSLRQQQHTFLPVILLNKQILFVTVCWAKKAEEKSFALLGLQWVAALYPAATSWRSHPDYYKESDVFLRFQSPAHNWLAALWPHAIVAPAAISPHVFSRLTKESRLKTAIETEAICAGQSISVKHSHIRSSYYEKSSFTMITLLQLWWKVSQLKENNCDEMHLIHVEIIWQIRIGLYSIQHESKSDLGATQHVHLNSQFYFQASDTVRGFALWKDLYLLCNLLKWIQWGYTFTTS